MTITVWSNVSDDWMLIHAVAFVWALRMLTRRALAAWGTVTADRNGVSVKYRWITRRTDLQRRWDWSEVSGLNSHDGLTIHLANGRTVHPIPPIPFGVDAEARGRDLDDFVRGAKALAETSGGPGSAAALGGRDPVGPGT
ncbi:MAG: hypothetical protein ABI470_01020 [Aquihabitans sp.]